MLERGGDPRAAPSTPERPRAEAELVTAATDAVQHRQQPGSQHDEADRSTERARSKVRRVGSSFQRATDLTMVKRTSRSWQKILAATAARSSSAPGRCAWMPVAEASVLQRSHPLARSEAGQRGRRISRARRMGYERRRRGRPHGYPTGGRGRSRQRDQGSPSGGRLLEDSRELFVRHRAPSRPGVTAGLTRRWRSTGQRSGGGSPRSQSFRATSGPVIRLRSGNVEAMIASDAASPPRTVAQ